MSDPTRLAWLIERGQSMQHVPTVWWTGDEWTTDAWAARRFDTREDAEAAIRVHSGRPTYGPFGIAVEHGFLDTTYHRRRVARRKSEHPMSDPTREALKAILDIVEETSGSLPALDRRAVENIARNALEGAPGCDDPECYGPSDPRCGTHNCTCHCHRRSTP